MFHSSAHRLRVWLKLAEDFVGDEPVPPPHPHRFALHWEPVRRPGAVAARPSHCISPVRASSAVRGRDRALR